MEKYKNCPFRHENGNCLPIGGFCTAIPENLCKALQVGYKQGKKDAVIHAYWDIDDNCSFCGVYKLEDLDAEVWNIWDIPYCPHCGAKMDEVTDDAKFKYIE